jgi:MtfA peptidase
MLFSWFKNRRRRQILSAPFPAAWDDVLRHNVGHRAWLADAERAKLRRATQIFIAETDFEGCRGLEMTDEIRVTVAASASILVLGLDDFYFDNVQTVLVYPDEFLVPDQQPIADDLVVHGESERLGEAHRHGPVILAWAEALANARTPGHGQNLVFHEFAHQIDMLNGDMDGVPALDDAGLRQRWPRVMDREYARLCRAADHGKKTLLDPYGATNPAEFFAVVTECFFDLPWELERRHAELYGVMRDYYRQDPALWANPQAGD